MSCCARLVLFCLVVLTAFGSSCLFFRLTRAKSKECDIWARQRATTGPFGPPTRERGHRDTDTDKKMFSHSPLISVVHDASCIMRCSIQQFAHNIHCSFVTTLACGENRNHCTAFANNDCWEIHFNFLEKT